MIDGHLRARLHVSRQSLDVLWAIGRKLTEPLDETLRRYHNRAVDSLQVIEELLALAADLQASRQRGEELGLSAEELAFYDALAENGSAKN